MKENTARSETGKIPSHNIINLDYLADEPSMVRILLDKAEISSVQKAEVHRTARELVTALREIHRHSSPLNALLQEYDLSSYEGVILMCLAESLLRIPDSQTSDDLIADKLSRGDWGSHLGESDSLFVNASTWALMLTGSIFTPRTTTIKNPERFVKNLITRLEEPVVRSAIKTAMSVIGSQFIMGKTIESAIKRSESGQNRQFRYTFDMLGEAALTIEDANQYLDAYETAIKALGDDLDGTVSLLARPSISVKLSALWPRFEYTQKDRAIKTLSERLLILAELAKDKGIALTVDAEESEQLAMTLKIFENVYLSGTLEDWPGFGLAVQTYQKRGMSVLRWLKALSQSTGRVIPVRLVKGAYWDTEIKRAQELGLKDYPVFSRKSNTDVAFLACSRLLLDDCEYLYPQFATHNAHAIAYIYHTAGHREYEFQCLHGMGERLYAEVVGEDKLDVPCRVYAPVGSYDDLLPYLVRRLLENGANTSFINQSVRDEIDIDQIIADPTDITRDLGKRIRHPKIPIPSRMFGRQRVNSTGINFADENELKPLTDEIAKALTRSWVAHPLIGGETVHGQQHDVYDPSDLNSKIGQVEYADVDTVKKALDAAERAWPVWNDTPAKDRAVILKRAADLYETHRAELVALCIREAGKTLRDSHTDVREAVDFLRYYALSCRKHFSRPVTLPGPSGETNQYFLQGHGIFCCISPWNFPVAIYTGQIAAALAAGNTVIAKPAEQTSLVAMLQNQLLYEAGIPNEVLNFLPGDGESIGKVLLSDTRIAGVAFTGSTETAQKINQLLSDRNAAIATFIAETGGINVMIVDSSALPQQVVIDVVHSAFNSAGQRCSALRVLYLQEDIADKVVRLLKGYMEQLIIGDPMRLETDIGPVIDMDARAKLEEHLNTISHTAKVHYRCNLPENTKAGIFFPPTVIELDNLSQLQKEVFGPVLHIIRYAPSQLDSIIEDINHSGYGLTLGVHTRIESRAEDIRRRARVGNIYVNRNMIGAVVGVQPFGGRGLSGTGPKAGGPNTLLRYATEQTYTVNTAAVGGNTTLLELTD